MFELVTKRLLIEIYENQIKDLKSDHEHNLKPMKGLNDKITDLEKENAELKEQRFKAKEIIEELLSWERRADYDYAEYDLIKDKAEQFIKEIEK